ncbi:MAG: NlpC/P60 family protein [Pyrinomonadaceae bacterium]
MNFRNYLCVMMVCVFAFGLFSSQTNAQDRSRVATTSQSRPVGTTTNTPQIVKQTSSRPTTPPPTVNRPVLTNPIIVRNNLQQETLIKKTGSSNPINTAENKTFNKAIAYNAVSQSVMLNSIKDLYGIPYRYGSTGPNRYDCSGFVWTVFQRAGFSFDRSSARTYWNQFEPVTGDDRYQFGTLVFLNGLGHIGIVADDKGFYHASSSKGITYSTFEGYWEKRIVGFRRVPLSYIRQIEAELAK